MLCQTPILITAMIFTTAACTIIGLILIWSPPTYAEAQCSDGRVCPDAWRCCEHGCCAPSTEPPPLPTREEDVRETPIVKDWYLNWPVLFTAATMAAVCLSAWCACWRGRHCSCVLACCLRRPPSDLDSSGSCYPPPVYSRCGSFHQPPPYAEVTSKPDLYPLVISAEKGGNCLMVHYFRNYVIRTPGSVSATSTAESLNSSYLCNAANEANSVVPPAYSRSPSAEWPGSILRSMSSLTDRRSGEHFPIRDPEFEHELEMLDYDLCCEAGCRNCRPTVGVSPVPGSPTQEGANIYARDYNRPRRLYSYSSRSSNIRCESPPQPTSPTQSRESLRQITDERRCRRPEYKRSRKSSLYMPLSTACPRPIRISPGSRVSSRSLPATPCGSIAPNLLALSQRVAVSRHGSRSSKLEEESDPLLTDDNNRADHKF